MGLNYNEIFCGRFAVSYFLSSMNNAEVVVLLAIFLNRGFNHKTSVRKIAKSLKRSRARTGTALNSLREKNYILIEEINSSYFSVYINYDFIHDIIVKRIFEHGAQE
jgi:predicted transcriptional regulator